MLSKMFLLIFGWVLLLKSYLNPLYKYVFYFFSSQNILEDINLTIKNPPSYPSVDSLTGNIKVTKLSNRTKTGDIILDNLSFDIINKESGRGQVVLLLGSSGSGKTTTANHIANLQTNQPGSIFLEVDHNNKKSWEDITAINDGDLRRFLVYQDQNPMIFDDSLKNNITLGYEFNNKQVFLILRIVRLDVLLTRGFSDENMAVYESISLKLDQELNQQITVKFTGQERALWKTIVERLNRPLINGGSNLSGGQRQRIGLARLLIKNATQRIILMDEATTGLDPENIHIIMNNYLNIFMNPQLNQFPRTLILVTHDIQFIMIIMKFCLEYNINLNFKYLSHGELAEDVNVHDIREANGPVWDMLRQELENAPNLLKKLK